MKKRAMLVANSASMIDHFNRDNISILKSMGYEIVVAANFKEGNSSSIEKINAFRNELIEQNIDILELPIPRKVTQLGKMLQSLRLMKEYLRESPCDIIHTQTPFGGVVGRLAAKKARREGKSRVIYFVHGFHFFKGADKKKAVIYHAIEKYLSKYTDCLITLNKEDYEAAKKLKAKDVRFVPGIGVNTDYIRNMQVDIRAKKEMLKIPGDRPVILCVSELIPRKNLEGAINAVAQMENQDAVLVVCGKGQEIKNLKRQAKEKLGNGRIYFTGYRTDILEIYHIADILLMTSFQEGLSVAVMQGMAAGLPVVASDIRGNRDLLGQTLGEDLHGCLIDVDDTEAFAKRLDALLDNPDEMSLIGNGNYMRCRKYFDISIVHDKMQTIYRELDD